MQYKAEIYYHVGDNEVLESVFGRKADSDLMAREWFDKLVENVTAAQYRATHARLCRGRDKIFAREVRVKAE